MASRGAQARYEAKRKKLGWRTVAVDVPADRADQIKAAAARLRAGQPIADAQAAAADPERRRPAWPWLAAAAVVGLALGSGGMAGGARLVSAVAGPPAMTAERCTDLGGQLGERQGAGGAWCSIWLPAQ